MCIRDRYKTTEEFVRQMLVYCCLSRENSPKEELEAEGCLVREQYMSERILKAAQKYERVLVVTGGFHTQGLYERTTAAQKADPLPLHKLDEKDQGIYPMAYSMEAADALNGYASGMQAPGFYHSVWRLCTEREVSAGSVRGAYEAVSYTHLDVYKRQPAHGGALPAFLISHDGVTVHSYR